MNVLLAADEYVVGVRTLLVVLTLGVCLSAVLGGYSLRSGGGNPTWIGLPRGIGTVAILLGTFGYALGTDIALFEDWDEHQPHAAAMLFVWGAGLCAAGHIVTWALEWISERRS